MSKKIRVFNFNENDGTASLARDFVINSTSTASNATIKWSNSRDNMLVASGFDGAMRVWDLNSQRDDEFFLKQFQCPMTCGMFLPTDENTIICAGRTTSIEMFNMLLENTQKFSNVKWKKQTMKTLDGVQWGTRIPTANGKSKTEKRRKRRDKDETVSDVTHEDIINDGEEVSGLMTKLQLEEKQENEISGATKCRECNDSVFLKNPQTILYLTTKEINKDSLDKLKFMLGSSHGKQRLLGPKLFGTQIDAKRILEEEIRNQQSSDLKSISNILTYQINSNLQQEVIKRIETKTLTEWHVSLAPSVSFMFWKKCCQAFINQLIEQGHILQAATYLFALHDTKQVVNILLEKQYFKEALIIAKIHCQPDDKITTEITEKWVNYLESVGNLNAAAYICAASGEIQKAYSILSKTRNITPEIQEVLDKLQEKLIKM